ncbi:MAG: hypothetical protein AUJ37_02060 [Candidatus Magasanikbacteria bacterium CG1_02_41_34]|uniref:Uncharacterized protein n=1 Tax=Candidatus Magasanikbacteria bacterium CG_4_10_14_0_2_um_filter_41_31 TaxID=1974639 RepID=A0A2M7V5K2_9BACT|nr:MAG: hypothetical protein AUJ37_02060 [Candidatus Magasanikbacteria bacterium CG1_02_41_34]PIZ93885.1 MAG: hypothetical protein COX83_00770 [Candidatus Magasanikbacteria bacterium CG_4_10_14_0_2_um_filter_41_31]
MLEEKQFEQFHTSDFIKSVEAFRALEQFFAGQTVVRFSEDPQSFPVMIRDIADIADTYTKETSEAYPFVQEKSVLEMFDMDTVTTFVKTWNAWIASYTQIPDTSSIEDQTYRVVSSADMNNFAKKCGVAPDSINFLTTQYDGFSDVVKQNISRTFGDVENSGEDMIAQIELLAGFLKVSSIQTYSTDEFKAVLAGDISTYEGPRLAATIRYMLDNDEGLALSAIAYEHLHVVDIYKKSTYTWDEAFYLTALLHAPFIHFRRLYWEFQEFWLMFYFVKAQIAGVPLTHILQDYLYQETATLLEYAEENIFLMKSLDKNKEMLPLGLDGEAIALSALYKDYMLRLGDKFNDGYRREEYIQEHVVHVKHKELWKHVLRTVLYIYSHIKSVDLIEKNRGSEPTEKEIYDNQLRHLLTWWMDEDFWQLIADFFTKPHTPPAIVPLHAVIAQIQQHESLEDPKVQDKAVRFNEFLREQGVLKEEQDIVVYNEQTTTFEWNKDIF